MIRFERVTRRYPDGFEALRDVSFDMQRGELVFVTGHSGAGKSTLLKLVAGIERPTSGHVLVAGQPLHKLPGNVTAMLRRNVGLMFQDHKLLFDRTLFDNVALPLHIEGYGRGDVARRVRAALDKVGLLGRERAYPVMLSGGEQQRLCIARAIVNRPAILIADEPTGNLDREYAEVIMGMFQAFHQVGVTLLVATHDTSMLQRFQGRRLHLEKGRLTTAGTAEVA